jgi:protein-S-isoprenylcysteine O-methyltransferase Ste14
MNMYDLLMRLPLLSWVLFCATIQLWGFVKYINKLPEFYAIGVAMRLSTITFMIFVAAAVILRTCPSRKASGLEPRISALAGTFMFYGFTMFPRHELASSFEIISTVLILIGSVGAVMTLSQLGRSLSIMAETRQLVTSGPYRFVRHPLYLTEEIAVVGVFIQFASVWTAILLVMQIAFQLRRMQNEETVLVASFPKYDAYRRSTVRLIPWIY